MSKPITTRWAAEQGVRFIKALRGRIEAMVGDDEQAIRDTIEGEVDVDPIMEKLIGLRQEAKAMAASRRALAATYADAARANAEQEERVKALIMECLKAAGQRDWKGVAGTVFIADGKWSVGLTQPEHIPLQYMKAVPDVDLIGKSLKVNREKYEAMTRNELVEETKFRFGGTPEQNAETFPKIEAAADPILIHMLLGDDIPGAKLVKGEDSLTIRLPSGKKAKAEPVDA